MRSTMKLYYSYSRDGGISSVRDMLTWDLTQGVVGNVPNGGISNFGTIIIKGFGFSTLVTTLMQVPYGIFISICILVCVFLNDRFKNRRCLFIIIFLIPNICGAFSLRFTPIDQRVGRLISYYLTGPYNAAFVLILSLQTANTAGKSCLLHLFAFRLCCRA